MDIGTKISELLIETKSFQDLDNPVILTSGELGIYYVNTEKLVQDNGEFEKYGDNSREMISHAVRMMDKNPTFKQAINMMIEKIMPYIAEAGRGNEYSNCFISGGQRRDWLFSGPIARNLGLKHVSIYKNGNIETVNPSLNICPTNLRGLYGIHVVDLLTEGSSVYRIENNKEKGWLPELKNKDAILKDLFTVVTRMQGGEKRLKEQGLNVHSFVSINEDFLKTYSRNPGRALEYSKNPGQWSENYLKENGALIFLDDFNPQGKKIERAKKFLKRYQNILMSTSGFYELERAVQEKYKISLDDIAK